MSILSLKDISYSYNKSYEKILRNVEMEFEEGKFYTIIGKSGSGKSTLLSILAGLDEPTKGEILFKGENIKENGYSYHRRKNIALVFQNYNLIDYLTPLENIRLVNKHASKDILLELGLSEEQINRNIMQLSRRTTTKGCNSKSFSIRSTYNISRWTNRKLGLKDCTWNDRNI